MTRLALLLAVVFILGRGTMSAELDRNAIARLHELILPELKLEEATLRAGLEVVRQAWSSKYPDESFPVITLEGFESGSDSGMRASMDLKNVPALTAVMYLAGSHAMSVRYGLDVIILRTPGLPDEGAWDVAILRISEHVMKALELSAETDRDEAVDLALKKRLENYGLEFNGFSVHWSGKTKHLIMRNTREEVSRLKGLVMLLEAGYTVQKSASE